MKSLDGNAQSMISSFIGVMIVIVVGVAVIVPVVQSILSDPKVQSGIPDSAKTIISFIPVFLLVTVAIFVLYTVSEFTKDDDTPTRREIYEDDELRQEYEPEEPSVVVHKKKPKKEPEIVDPIEPVVPKKYKKHGKSYRTIRADMLLDEKNKKVEDEKT